MERIHFTKDQKITLYAALIAFALSFLIGLISGNPVFVVIVRACISAVLFSAVLYGGLYLLRRYIPDMTVTSGEGGETGQVEQPSGELGKQVDYTVSENTAVEDMAERLAAQSAGTIPDSASARTAQRATPAEGIPATSRSSGEPAEDGLEGLTLEPLEGQESGSEEELPSLDQLFEEHDQKEAPDIKPSSTKRDPSRTPKGNYIKVGDATIPYEPEVLAKAVKRVMKQDE